MYYCMCYRTCYCMYKEHLDPAAGAIYDAAPETVDLGCEIRLARTRISGALDEGEDRQLALWLDILVKLVRAHEVPVSAAALSGVLELAADYALSQRKSA